ncbi:E1 ubiquitin-activating protein uba2 [Gonapodya sp. JEL0774]|nr:E1 ubiquitin-activating protein uba2 [Gonapodya sp. JEL0774]
MTDSERRTHLKTTLGPSLVQSLGDASILMVGAGGIGCELLKTLLLSGVKNITVKQHISKAKAHVARESALRFNPQANVISHHANIKDPIFDVAFFRKFTVVMNALDNLGPSQILAALPIIYASTLTDARSHVNLMCLAADRPLIEAGTTGFQGQSYVIKKRITACYDCTPKVLPKTYAVCTIRSTPSLPIHCVVWAKSYLFSQLFGSPSDSEDPVLDTTVDAENVEEIGKLKVESDALKVIKDAMGSDDFPRMVFEKVFDADVKRLLSMPDLWKSRKAPTPLSFDDVAPADEKDQAKGKRRAKGKLPSKKEEVKKGERERLEWEQKLWTLEESAGVFLKSVRTLAARFVEARASDAEAGLSFDKDDDPVMDFVAATANLRAHIYQIDRQSRFNAKQMAGSIIPAVATANAIVSGVMVLHLFKLLASTEVPLSGIKRVTLSTSTGRGSILTSESNFTQNPECGVCTAGFVVVETDTRKMTLRDLVERVIRGADGLSLKGDLSINENAKGHADVYYDDDFTDNLDKTLEALKITHGKNIQAIVDDDDAGTKRMVYIFILQRDDLPSLFTLSGDKSTDIPTIAYREAAAKANAKRQRDEGMAEREESTKRARLDGGGSGNPIVLDDDDDTITLD